MVGSPFKCDFVGMWFDRGSYEEALLNALRHINEVAGRAWLKAAVDETPIPTWSGASRSTFQKLASDLGTAVPIGPIRAKKNRIALGRANAGASGKFEDRKNLIVGFIYETTLQYLAYNEYNAAVAGPPPQPYSNNVRFTPYNFQGRAQAAWEFEASRAKLPDPTNYIRTRKL